MFTATPTLGPTLAGSIGRLPAVVREVALLGTGVLAIALFAQVVVPLPFTPVPLTGQTLAVLVVGGAYGTLRGGLTTLAYVGLGVLGAPVFAGGAHGPTVVLSSTGGYLLGMVLAAVLVGRTAERGWDRRLAASLGAMLLGTLAIYAAGAAWLAVVLEVAPLRALELGVVPFVIGDVVKAACAAVVLPVAWRLVNRAVRDTGRD